MRSRASVCVSARCTSELDSRCSLRVSLAARLVIARRALGVHERNLHAQRNWVNKAAFLALSKTLATGRHTPA